MGPSQAQRGYLSPLSLHWRGPCVLVQGTQTRVQLAGHGLMFHRDHRASMLLPDRFNTAFGHAVPSPQVTALPGRIPVLRCSHAEGCADQGPWLECGKVLEPNKCAHRRCPHRRQPTKGLRWDSQTRRGFCQVGRDKEEQSPHLMCLLTPAVRAGAEDPDEHPCAGPISSCGSVLSGHVVLLPHGLDEGEGNR